MRGQREKVATALVSVTSEIMQKNTNDTVTMEEDIDSGRKGLSTTTDNGQHANPDSPILAYPSAPKRPISAYIIFFQMERKRILAELDDQSERGQTIGQTRCGYTHQEVASFMKIANKRHEENVSRSDENQFSGNPPRSTRKQVRRHVRSHGMIGFTELSREVSNRWKYGISSEERDFFKNAFKEEMKRYRDDLREWQKQKHRIRLQYSQLHQRESKMIDQGSCISGKCCITLDIGNFKSITNSLSQMLRKVQIMVLLI